MKMSLNSISFNENKKEWGLNLVPTKAWDWKKGKKNIFLNMKIKL